ncbi:MAG TPA: DUF6531 domain-containing protein, partial [Bryobacteraceae bacterium]|nr:DUF6531 domain-containing protein [Bryobacteraceae bacterium]
MLSLAVPIVAALLLIDDLPPQAAPDPKVINILSLTGPSSGSIFSPVLCSIRTAPDNTFTYNCGGTLVFVGTCNTSGGCSANGTVTLNNQTSSATLTAMPRVFTSGPGYDATLNSPGANLTNVVNRVIANSSNTTNDQVDASVGADPISLLTGERIEEPPSDLSLGGPQPVALRRYHSSFLATNSITGSLGANWRHNFDVRAFTSATQATVLTFRGRQIRFVKSGSAWSLFTAYPFGYQFADNAGGGFRFLDPESNLVYTFAASGFLTRIEDRNGNALTVTQGTNGPTQVADGLGRTLSFSYTVDGKLARVQDQSGRAVSYGYTAGVLTSYVDAAGKTTQYASTTAGRINSTTLPAGNIATTQTFDASDRVTSQTDARGNRLSIAYGPTTGAAAITDALGNVTNVSHTNLLEFTGSVDATGAPTSTAYDANLRPVGVRDRNGNVSLAAYHSPSGYPAAFTDALGNKTTFTYVSSVKNGFTFYDVSAISFADGTTQTFAYDANGNLTKGTDQAGKATTFTYNTRGQVLTRANPAGGVSTFTYNADGTLATLKSPAGNTTTSSYDPLKRLTKTQFADGAARTFAYDALDRLTQITDPRSKTTSASYTDNGPLKSITDPLGNSATFSYDASENLSSIKDPAGTATAAYNAVNLISSITSPTGETATVNYDKLNRVSSVADSVGQLSAFSYDKEGALTSLTDGANRTVKVTPDALGRPTQIMTPLGEMAKLSFDKTGHVTSVQDALGAT